MELAVQIFGIIFVGIIIVCIGWTIVEYALTGLDGPDKRNKKLLDKIKKLK